MPITQNITNQGFAYFPGLEGGRVYKRPCEIVEAHVISDVLPALERVAAAVKTGKHAAGYVAYEAAPAFDAALRTHPPADEPILWFGLYDDCTSQVEFCASDYSVGKWQALADSSAYQSALKVIRRHIEAGDSYQVNYTFPMETHFTGDTRTYFKTLCAAQGGGYPAYIDTGRYQVLSASPELFFSLAKGHIRCKPMKGTRPRGLWAEVDQAHAKALALSEKDRAENIMIVDMVRNDLGRIASPGSVKVASTFDVERFETVWQMTSTVEAVTKATVPEIFAALFPCASVTGAPKVETMKIIQNLERQPRGVYCGAIGWWAPDGRACFNVPIRTVWVDTATEKARYHVGSGVTWDSVSALEYEECLDKAALLQYNRPEMALLETLLWEDGHYFLLDEHLKRLATSAIYFGFSCDIKQVLERLNAYTHDMSEDKVIRLTLTKDGAMDITQRPVPEKQDKPLLVALAPNPVDMSNPLLYHKTTARQLYETARTSRADCDDVLLWNERGELTESTISNIVLRIDGKLLTPPVESGLLQGVYRSHLLAQGKIEEAVLHKSALEKAEEIFLINSVRRWCKAALSGG